jgi:hypothetical protein
LRLAVVWLKPRWLLPRADLAAAGAHPPPRTAQGGTLSLTLHLKPENAQVLFATAANAPPGTWEATAASLKPTRAQRVMLRQLWHAYAGRTQAIRAERAAAMAAVHQAAAAANVTPDTLPASTLG